MSVNELTSLEQQVDELLNRLDQLKRENSSLRESQSALMGDRAQLVEKTEKAIGDGLERRDRKIAN